MDSRLLQQELQNYFRDQVQAVEPTSVWWANAVARATERTRPLSRGISVRRTRLLWILVPLAVALLAGIAYASSSVIRERFASLFPQVEKTGFAQEVNISQTVDGVTVRVERIYADSLNALVGYTISGPPITSSGPGARYFSKSSGLAVEGGPALPVVFESGTVPGSKDVLGDWAPSDRLAVVAGFDASAVQGTPSQLSVRLNVRVYDRVPLPNVETVQRNFAFDFTVNFHPATVVNVNQTIEASGVPITVERLMVAHSATRIIFGFAPPYDDPKYTPALHSFLIPAGASTVEGTSLFYGDYTKNTGEWTLTISELIFFQGLPPGVDLGVPANQNGQIRPQGVWSIRFNVP